MLGSSSGRSAAASGNPFGELGENSVTFERQVAARHRGTGPQRLHQSLIQTPRAEQSALDQHLAALLGGRTARRDEDDLAVGVSGLAGRCLRDVDRPARDEGGEAVETGQGIPDRQRSRPGQDGVDEFAEGADDIRIVGEHLDDGRLDGTAQAESFGDEAAGEDQHPSGGHFAQR